MRVLATILLILGAQTLAGCSLQGPLPGARCRQWLARRGGLEPAAALPPRLVAASRTLLGDDWAEHLTVAVIDSAEVGAYAWPRRHVFVTRGLLDAAPDDELIAALAHELGHLIDDGHVRPPFALRGTTRARRHDAESRADALGCALLINAGQDPAAMARLLQRLGDQPRTSARTQQHLTARLRSLRPAP